MAIGSECCKRSPPSSLACRYGSVPTGMVIEVGLNFTNWL